MNKKLAEEIRAKVYADTPVHASVLLAIEEWLADPDTERSGDETIESLTADVDETDS